MDTPPKVKITSSLADPNTYKKWIVYAVITLAVGLVIFGGVALWHKWFPKPPTTSVGDVNAGGVVNIVNKTGRSRFIIPFVEGGAEARDNQKIGAFVRLGLRLEW